MTITAQTVEQLRSQSLTNLRGRRDGIDNAGYSVGCPDHRLPIDNGTSGSTATQFSPVGLSVLNSSSSAIFSMALPIPGTYKQLTQVSTSTLGLVVQAGAGVKIISSAGSSANQITFAGLGHTINLFAASSATWLATGTGAGITLSTY